MRPDTALIEFLKVNIWPGANQAPGKVNIQPESRYQVFVLHKKDNGQTEVAWHDLGGAAEIDDLVRQLRRTIEREMRRIRGVTVADDNPRVPVDRSIFKRLGQKIAATWIAIVPKCEHLYIVPDGSLHGLPWAAIPGYQSQHLIEETSMSLLGRGPALLKRHSSDEGLTEFLLVGDVDYGHQPERSQPRLNWDRLQGTRQELQSIRRLAGERFSVTPLASAEATEATTIQHLSNSTVAHFATHGFFTSDDNVDAKQNSAAWRDPMLASVAGRNPLSRCGVVLANANQLPRLDPEGIPHGNDGLLTGEELCDLDLRRVELVVLSACETGLGQVNDNEGTFGLHRALSSAGARATIGSLWQVSDDATTKLMTEFYQNLLTPNARVADALRQAQLKLLNEKPRAGTPSFTAPYYWAAFIVSGDPNLSFAAEQAKAADPNQDE